MQDNSKANFYAMIYGVSTAGMLALQIVRGLLYNSVVVRAASTMHGSLFMKVCLACTMFGSVFRILSY